MKTENQNIEFKESWGRGIEKICTLCKNYGIPEPEYTVHLGKPLKGARHHPPSRPRQGRTLGIASAIMNTYLQKQCRE